MAMNFTESGVTSGGVGDGGGSGGVSSSGGLLAATQIEYVINRFLLPPTVIFGIIGNMFNLIILSNKKARTSSAMVMLIAMSVLDLLNLLIQIPHLICNEYRFIMSENYYLVFQRYYYAFVMYPWANTMTTGVALLSAAVALDRFAAIKNIRPLYRTFHKHSTRVTAGIIISSVLINVIKHFELRPVVENSEVGRSAAEIELMSNASTALGSRSNHSVVSTSNNNSNSQRRASKPNNELMVVSMIDSDAYRYLSYWGFGAIQVLLPMTILVIFGGIVVVTFIQIRSHQKRAFGQERARKNGGNDKISFATRMVIATIVVFISCNWTSVVLIAAVAASGRVILMRPFFAALRQVNNYLTVAHSSINFLLYCTTCAQYRFALKRLFSHRRKPIGHGQHQSQSMQTGRLSQHVQAAHGIQINIEEVPSSSDPAGKTENHYLSDSHNGNKNELVPFNKHVEFDQSTFSFD